MVITPLFQELKLTGEIMKPSLSLHNFNGSYHHEFFLSSCKISCARPQTYVINLKNRETIGGEDVLWNRPYNLRISKRAYEKRLNEILKHQTVGVCPEAIFFILIFNKSGLLL